MKPAYPCRALKFLAPALNLFFAPFQTMGLIVLCLSLSSCLPSTSGYGITSHAIQGNDFPDGNSEIASITQETGSPESLVEEDPENDTKNPALEIAAIETDAVVIDEIPLPSEEEITSFEAQEENQSESLSSLLTEETDTIPEITYDYPMAMNRKVQFFLDHFQHTQPENFRKWLSRSARYLPMIQKKLKEAGMPLDLAYLPMIESGFLLTAYSSARAAGPWQFLRSTGRMYGLKIDNYVDERRDPVKSTAAAISFLKDLYRDFNSWHLATAAYNGGAGRIGKAIKKTGSTDFWTLANSSHIKRETKYYVPKLIAAIMIAKDPEKYGFTDIEYEPPLEYEILEVPRWTSLQAVAVAGDLQLEYLRDLNRQLRRAITPPEVKRYPLKVPPGKKELIEARLPRVNAIVTTSYKTHVVKKGDSLTRICNNYNINKKTLLKANNLRTAELKAGQRLRIPYKTTSYKLFEENQVAGRITPADMAPENLVLHKVKRGETISELARRYNVPMHMIAAWNGLNNLNSLRAGQQLAFYLQDTNETGDDRLATLADSSNNPANDQKPGKVLRVNLNKNGSAKSGEPEKSSSKLTGAKLTYYQVKGGDSLWAIAEKFQTTPEKIRQWNSMEDNIIYPGHRLLLRVIDDIDA